ncbi:MAG: hypothetical protein PHN88_14835 [Ignavibacteria bacterium]|nr:hypothetical protein [Ignavibacteria bacterium]
MKQVVNLGTLLAKIQGTFGTMQTPLATTDFAQCGKNEIQMDNPVTEIDTVGGGFGQESPVTGPCEATHTLSFPLRSTGIQDSPGKWTEFLKGSGFKESAASHIYTYTLGKQSDWKDITAWGYAGGTSTLRYILYNLLYNPKINLDFSTGYGEIEFSGKGVFSGDSDAQTDPAVTRTLPETKSLIGYVGNIFGDATADPLIIAIDFGNEMSVCNKPNATDGSGKGMSLLTKAAIKYTITYYVDTANTFKPHASIRSGTYSSFTIAWGTAPNKITIADSNVRITNVKSADKNGVRTYEVSAVSVGNGISIAVDTTSA